MSVAAAGPALRVGLLGTLTLHVDGEAVDVPGELRRTLLAALAMAQGRVLATERLVDLTWPESPPDDALRALYNHVSRLRKHLGPAGHRLSTREAGYALELGEDEVDVRRARRLADGLAGRTPAEVAAAAQEALGLWRGPALAEFRGHPDLSAAAIALDELHARLRDDLTEARLELGDRNAVADALEAAAAQPLRERTAILLVRSLARDGQQAEAMERAAAYRRRLAEETGLDAGPALATVEQDVAAGALAPPPEASVGAALPTVAQPTGPMVGRDRDRDEVRRLLGEHRIVTVTGPGGVGKTRLALDVAAQPAGSVDAAVVDLAAVADPARVPQAVGSTLLLHTSDDVTRRRRRPHAVRCAPAAGPRQLRARPRRVSRARGCPRPARAPDVQILSTSRIVLNSRSEYVVRLQPLPVPALDIEDDALERQPSVQAFVEHARRRDRSFALRPADTAPLVEVLRRLDGLPLAIEIAAAYAVTMPISTVRDRLALDLASPDGPSDHSRQTTLRATIRWSYDMLDPGEQTLLRAIALFPGGVDLLSLERLATEVAPDHDAGPAAAPPRGCLAVERRPGPVQVPPALHSSRLPARRGAVEGEADAAESRFVRRSREIAAGIGTGLVSEDEREADLRLRAELPNLRAARDLARERGDVDALVDITLELDQPAMWRDLRELWAWCLELANNGALKSHPRAVEILGAAAEAARLGGSYDRAVDLAERGLAAGGTLAQEVRCRSALAGVSLYRGQFVDAAVEWSAAAGSAAPGFAGAYLASAALATGYAGEVAGAHVLLDRARAAGLVTPCRSNDAFARYVSGELTAPTDPQWRGRHLRGRGRRGGVGRSDVRRRRRLCRARLRLVCDG